MEHSVDLKLYQEVAKFGARDMEICMQCGICSASCPLSTGTDTFPRKIYRYLQLGLRDKLLQSPVPWLCYYCGDCNLDCPRGAEPAETMMATRRWLTTQYDWTGLAKKFYLSEVWELGALGVVALGIMALFWFFHGPIITDRVAVNTFVPVLWIEIGDLSMAAVLTLFLLSNAFRMFRFIMSDTTVPFRLYLTEAKAFVLHFATQKRWRECGEDKSRWLKHFLLVSGYMTMMTLIIVFIRWFQVDDSSWHFSSLFGYYATGVIMFITIEMFQSRRRKQEAIHRFSELSDWLFLILLFLTTLTGIIMHIVRLAGWPMGTYVMYVIHLAIAVPMLVIEVPFGKWSHLFYRPLALFLTTVREKAVKQSSVDIENVKALIGKMFMTCVQCGSCTAACPWNRVSVYSPRQILRHIGLDTGTKKSVDDAAWDCVTCNACGDACPRGINIIDVIRSIREIQNKQGKTPAHLEMPLEYLAERGNPWGGDPGQRSDWAKDIDMPDFNPEHAYCLFTCCATAYDDTPSQGCSHAGRDLLRLLIQAGVSFGTLGTEERCCGDPAFRIGAVDGFSTLSKENISLFQRRGVKRVLTTSPHCLDIFRKAYADTQVDMEIEHYTELLDRLVSNGSLTPKFEVKNIVTFHDPCYLGRHNGVYDAPRRILRKIPGLSLVEMPDNRNQSLCCGGGGGGVFGDHSSKGRLAELRIEQALDTGAGVIATACPYCTRMLQEAIRTLGFQDRIVVQDVAELLIQSIKMRYEYPMPAHINLELDQEVLHA
ncbi:heterodisulfide reductase-related iron-sulfur binding cluster [Thermodesulfobacteriota bacterium]